MGTYPWGPHGPQSGPNEVTPNPTPSYVPPPPSPSYTPPAPAPYYAPAGSSSYVSGSYSSASVAYTGPIRPRRKHYFLALILTFVFGPLGLLYATKKSALAMLFLLIAVPVTLGVVGVLPGGSPSHPFAILDHDSVMNGMWSISVVLSMVWSVIAVNRHNAALKAEP